VQRIRLPLLWRYFSEEPVEKLPSRIGLRRKKKNEKENKLKKRKKKKKKQKCIIFHHNKQIGMISEISTSLDETLLNRRNSIYH
jgi:hypothetical protein